MPRSRQDPFAKYRARPETLVGTFWWSGEVSSAPNITYQVSYRYQFCQLVAVEGSDAVLVQYIFGVHFFPQAPFRVPLINLLSEHGKLKHLGRLKLGAFVNVVYVDRHRPRTERPRATIVYRILSFDTAGPRLQEAYRSDRANDERTYEVKWDQFVGYYRRANWAENALVSARRREETAELDRLREAAEAAPVPGEAPVPSASAAPNESPMGEVPSVWDRLETTDAP